jgi:hypothetical protein
MPELKRYNVRLADKLKNPHVLALRTLKTSKQIESDNWSTVLATICAMRKRKFDWCAKISTGPSDSVKRWIRQSPILKEWVKSDACLVSPAEWPKSVYAAFRHRLIPSPHEIANVDMVYKYALNEWSFRNYLVVLLYCMGFTEGQISEGYGVSEKEVRQLMFNGIEALVGVPQFLIWATATDFKQAMLPGNLTRVPIRKRARFLAALQSNPFLADTQLCSDLIRSPSYFSYLIYATPKRMRLSKGCRIHRTSEELHVSTKP